MKHCWILPRVVPQAWLRANLPEETFVLALRVRQLALADAPAQWDAPRRGVVMCAPEEFVPYAEIRRIACRATELTQPLVRAAGQGKTIDGYDIPVIDWQAQESFLRETLLAARLGEALVARNLETVTWVNTAGGGASEAGLTDRASVEILRRRFGDRFRVQEGRMGAGQAAGRAEHALGRKAKLALGLAHKKLFYRPTLPAHAKALGIFPAREWERFTDALEGLAKGFGNEFQIWSMGRPTPALKEWAHAHGTAPVWMGYPNRVDADIKAFFEMAWGEWQRGGWATFAAEAALPELAPQPALAFYFEFYFKQGWTHLAQWARDLERFMRAAEPEWVVASSDYVPAYALGHYVAKKLGIPSVALPHTAVPQGNAPAPGTFVACRNAFQALSHGNGAAGYPTPLFCRDAANEMTYTPSAAPPRAEGRRKVLMLVTDEDQPGTVMAKIDRAEFLETFRAVTAPPVGLQELEFVFKGHPRFDVSDLLARLVPAGTTNVTILDPRTPLAPLLEASRLVVLCNYFGSAAVAAAEHGKPMILLDTAGNFWPGLNEKVREAGQVVREVSAFWDLVRELEQSPEKYEALAEKARRFAGEYLKTPQATLAQYLSTPELMRNA